MQYLMNIRTCFCFLSNLINKQHMTWNRKLLKQNSLCRTLPRCNRERLPTPLPALLICHGTCDGLGSSSDATFVTDQAPRHLTS